MTTLDVRRHTMRRKPGAHLSQEGIELARFVARGTDSYDFVVTSEIPRAIETAIAMGFEVNELIVELGILPENILETISWPSPLAKVERVLRSDADCIAFTNTQVQLWTSIAARVPNEGRGLLVTHGGIIDLGVVAFLMASKRPIEGGTIGYCEGVRLEFSSGRLTHAEMLRVPEHLHLSDSKS
jgi:broad specificity phosphatase PhoE